MLCPFADLAWTANEQKEYEIYIQLLNAAGDSIAANAIRVSDMGPDGDNHFGAVTPAVAWNAIDNQYLVVWWGDDDLPQLVDDKYDVFVQRVSPQGNMPLPGVNDQRISEMDGVGNPTFGTFFVSQPKVAYNSANDEFLVVWSADDDTGSLVDEEFEIFRQRFKSLLKSKLRVNRRPPKNAAGTRGINGR